MDNTGLSEQPIELPQNPDTEIQVPVAETKSLAADIPEAQRDVTLGAIADPQLHPQWRRWKYGLLGLLGMAIALLAGIVAHLPPTPLAGSSPSLPTPAAVTSTTAPPQQTTVLSQPTPPSGTLLGHFPFPEAPAETLRPVTGDGQIKLRAPAAENFQEMVAAARRERVFLVPISGFRSIDDQNYLFFDIKAQQGETPRQRAEVSAPPGYSEHHTGYAIDIGDATRRDTDLEISFEDTPAFRWLQANAARYSFELSFPRNNPQGVSYEPWHWRFVGDRHSLETFYRSRNPSFTVTPVTLPSPSFPSSPASSSRPIYGPPLPASSLNP